MPRYESFRNGDATAGCLSRFIWKCSCRLRFSQELSARVQTRRVCALESSLLTVLVDATTESSDRGVHPRAEVKVLLLNDSH